MSNVKIKSTNVLSRAVKIALVGAILNMPLIAYQNVFAANAPKFAQGRILVQPVTGVDDNDLALELNRHGAKSIHKIGRTSVHVVNVPAQAEEAVVNALKRNLKIEFAEVDRLVAVDMAVNDPSATSQWHLAKINAPTAWDSSNGSNVIVAVLDTGVNVDHVDLQGQLLPGWNAVDQSTNYSDIQGHGTLVSGTIAATTNNSTGVASVAWGVKILPIRVSNTTDGYAYYSDIARGVTWAADQGARVANISYDATPSASITSAAQYMISKGGLVVTSAGNSGTDLGYADNAYMISVSATDSNDNITSWSSFGNYVDVTAPGAGILTTNKSGTYSSVSGTSFSSPITAGVVALIMAANNALTPDEVESVLRKSAKDVNNNGWDNKYGFGRVDAAAAVALALSTTSTTDTQAPTVSLDLVNGSTVSGIVAITATANDNVGVSKVELRVNGVLQATDTTAPFNFTWDSTKVNNGSVTVEVRAFDAAGNNTSTTVTINVSNAVAIDDIAPSVVITSPSDGSTIKGTAKITVAANDNIGVAKLQAFLDNTVVASTTNVTAWSFSLNTRKFAVGVHTITVQAFDAAGNNAVTTMNVNIIR